MMPPFAPIDMSVLRELAANAKYVLLDFDGPVARLFAGHPAEGVAAVLRQQLLIWEVLPPESPVQADPLQVLRDAVALGRAKELEGILTEQELVAAETAVPTQYADRLIHLLCSRGRKLAITTNNSPRVALRYLSGRELGDYFGPHIYGRTDDPRLMKPHPSCLLRALKSMGAAADECLMIGDSADDFTAANECGVTFLGYARDDDKEEKLRKAGASHVVRSLETLCVAIESVESPANRDHLKLGCPDR
jgi:phosphoglycolate phosphatase